MPGKKSKGKQEGSIGVRVPGAEAIVRPCTTAIKRLISSDKVGFTKSNAAGNREIYRLTGDNQYLAEAKYEVPAHLLYESKRRLYWLGAAIEFYVEQGIYYLVSISLIIFEGDRESEKVPLLRAEWSNDKGFIEAKHAQPHWHVYSGQINYYTQTSRLNTEPFPIEESNEADSFLKSGDRTSSWETGDKFHFAMVSSWHTNSGSDCTLSFTATSITKWVEGCLGYTREQVKHLCKKEGGVVISDSRATVL